MDQEKKPKRPAIGGISQYATIGGKSSTPQNFEQPNVQHVEAPDVQMFEHSTPQHFNTSNTRKSKVQNSKRLNIERVQQTAWLPLDLARWLRLKAAMEDREISEIITDALKMYRTTKRDE